MEKFFDWVLKLYFIALSNLFRYQMMLPLIFNPSEPQLINAYTRNDKAPPKAQPG